MAYFVIIGTDNCIMPVVDEIVKSHQSLHVVTTGCLIRDEEPSKDNPTGQTYKWSIPGRDKSDEREEGLLRDFFTNQVSHFRNLIPMNANVNIVLVGRCYEVEDVARIKLMAESLKHLGGQNLGQVFLDVVLLGFDLSKPEDVTRRPDWHLCKKAFEYFDSYTQHNCRVVYLNNIDYRGAAVTLETKLLGRLIGDWSSVISHFPDAKGFDTDRFYAFGAAEYRYDFNDLVDFFSQWARRSILDHKLSDTPGKYTQELLDTNETFDYSKPWIDGLGKVRSQWAAYADAPYDFSKSHEENGYTLKAQMAEIADSLCDFLRAYSNQDPKASNFDYPKSTDIADYLRTHQVMTSREKNQIESLKGQYDELLDFIGSESCLEQINEAIEAMPTYRPGSFPSDFTLQNIGFKQPMYNVSKAMEEVPQEPAPEPVEEKKGCLFNLFNLFGKKKKPKEIEEEQDISPKSGELNNVNSQLPNTIYSWIEAFHRGQEAKQWWKNCNDHIKSLEKERENLNLKLSIWQRPQSKTLVEPSMVMDYIENNPEYHKLIDELIDEYFNKHHHLENRETEGQFIQRIVIDPLKDKYCMLRWDGSNPFVRELMDDSELGEKIRDCMTYSNMFVESNHLREDTLVARFYSNISGLPVANPDFVARFALPSSPIVSVKDFDFTNALGVTQVVTVAVPAEEIADFAPKNAYMPFETEVNWSKLIKEMLPASDSKRDKARAIYDWLCDNIEYDTTLTIHDADRCVRSHHGVCQAYCEVFLRLAREMGLAVEVVTGKVKMPNGKVPEEKHAWLFVYTHGYEGIFLDPTWGAGNVSDGVFCKNTNTDEWFDVDPRWMIYSHFPDNTEWTKLEIEVPEERFLKLPYRRPNEKRDTGILIDDLAKLAAQG